MSYLGADIDVMFFPSKSTSALQPADLCMIEPIRRRTSLLYGELSCAERTFTQKQAMIVSVTAHAVRQVACERGKNGELMGSAAFAAAGLYPRVLVTAM